MNKKNIEYAVVRRKDACDIDRIWRVSKRFDYLKEAREYAEGYDLAIFKLRFEADPYNVISIESVF